MQLPFIASAAVLLSLAQAAAATPAGQRPFALTAAHRSSDGRYGFKRCVDKGIRPGKISCLNFDALPTSNHTALGPPPPSPLVFSAQWSVFNISRGKELWIVPPKNLAVAVSPPNALIGSRFKPSKANSAAPVGVGPASVPSIRLPDSSPTKTFDLFGFYIQPMETPPGIRGVDVYIEATAIDGAEYSFGITFLPAAKAEPWYFEPYTVANEKWDRLTEVRVWAQLSGAASIDWEFFVDNVWVRWGNETEGPELK